MNDSPEQNCSHSSSFTEVLEFHKATGVAVNVGIFNKPNIRLRLKLIKEELRELTEALEKGDLVKVADGLGDLIYVVNGAAVTFGIDMDTVNPEIHRSNMTKLNEDGTPVLREDGKVLKGPLFDPPHLTKEIIRGRFIDDGGTAVTLDIHSVVHNAHS